MTDIFLVGKGKMGSAVKKECLKRKDFRILGEASKKEELFLKEGGGGVIVDFSNRSLLPFILCFALKNKMPLVTGTTGLSEQDFFNLREASKKIPVFYSANMSMGMSHFISMAKSFPQNERADVEILEVHHRDKKDVPSGTALMIKNSLKRDCPVHSVRAGTIFGEHRIIFAMEGENIELIHRAEGRDIFAKGALRAAELIENKSEGFYTMEDLIGEA